MTRASMVAELRELRERTWGSPEADRRSEVIADIADALEQETRELERVRDEMRKARSESYFEIESDGNYDYPTVDHKVDLWADALTKVIGDGK